MATYVLIPGAGMDPRIYDATINELERLGHRALAPALPLGDPDAHPSDHAAAVVGAVPADTGIVVVAQSLGAFTGPLVAARVRTELLVLLAPMIPMSGETAGEWWKNTGHPDAIADLLSRYGPMNGWELEALEEVFLHDVDPDVARATAKYNGAPGPGMFSEPWPLIGWPDVPTRVLAPRGDRLFLSSSSAALRASGLGLPWTRSTVAICRCCPAPPNSRGGWSNCCWALANLAEPGYSGRGRGRRGPRAGKRVRGSKLDRPRKA